MDKITLYPELIDYIYEFCSEFKTNDERLAGQTLLYNSKNMNEKMRKLTLSKGWYSKQWQNNADSVFTIGIKAFNCIPADERIATQRCRHKKQMLASKKTTK